MLNALNPMLNRDGKTYDYLKRIDFFDFFHAEACFFYIFSDYFLKFSYCAERERSPG